MADPVKIFELKRKDMMTGLSIQSGLALGGLFASISNFDPFNKMGYIKPSLSPVQIDGTTITTEVKSLTSYGTGSSGYTFALGDRSGTGAKCLYRIKLDDQTVTDYSSVIDQNATTGSLTHNGCIFFKNRFIYEQAGSIRSNTFTPTAPNDTNLLSSSLTGSSVYPTIFGVGHDGNLYFTAEQGASIGKIVTVNGTTSNTASTFSFSDTSLIPKDITNDGIYTIFIADNNTNKITTASTSCRIFFWDGLKTRADIIYDIPDTYLISAKYVNGRVVILGYSGIWVCNSATPPKLVFPLIASMLPKNAQAVRVSDNTLYWASGSTQRKIYAYGSKIGNSILYSPYNTTSSDNLANALDISGSYLINSLDAGTNTSKVYLHNSGSTVSTASVQTVASPLEQPYKFAFAKVVFDSPLSSGETIDLNIANGNGSVIMDTTTKGFSTDGAKQSLKFEPKPTTGSFSEFEDIYFTLSTNATVQRVAIYASPIDDDSQRL